MNRSTGTSAGQKFDVGCSKFAIQIVYLIQKCDISLPPHKRKAVWPRTNLTNAPITSIELHLNKASLSEKFAMIHEHWRPKVVAQLNGQEVKLVKFAGVFPWHHHEKEDEMFWSGVVS